MENHKRFFSCILFVLICLGVSGQIDVVKMKKLNGDGVYTLNKKIDVSFFLDEKTKSYRAKVKYKLEQLFLNVDNDNGMTQLPFNTYQDLKITKARFFKLDTLGEKVLIENVKVKYADTKDYFIENIFYNDLKVKQFRSELELPENYVLNYGYEVIYKDLKFLTSLYIQNGNEYIQNAEIIIHKNPNVNFEAFEFNLKDRVKRSENDKAITYTSENLKRYKNHNYSVGGNYYLPHLIISVKSVESSKGKREVLNSVDNIYAWYNSLIQSLSTDEPYIKSITNSLNLTGKSDDEKIESIFNWVQNNIQYVAFEDGIAGFKPTEAQDVAQVKFGDCKGMANLLVNMLRSQGFDAHHAWIGTRSNNYSYSMPSLVVDNHMICCLKYKGKKHYLDATSKSARWNTAPAHLEGKEVLIADNDNYIIEKIKKSLPETNKLEITGKINFKETVAIADLQISWTGHFTNQYISYNTHFPVENLEYNHIYIIEDYLPWLEIKSYTPASIEGNKTTFTVSGTINELAFSKNKMTTFPFYDVLPYRLLNENNPPVYIEFPHKIVLDMLIPYSPSIALNLQNNVSNNTTPGFSSNFEIITEGSGQRFKQEIEIDALHSPLLDAKEWNDFINKYKSHNLIPITYVQP